MLLGANTLTDRSPLQHLLLDVSLRLGHALVDGGLEGERHLVVDVGAAGAEQVLDAVADVGLEEGNERSLDYKVMT